MSRLRFPRVPEGVSRDIGAALILLLLPLILFAPVALGRKTLIPADALFLFEPFRSAAADLGVATPHNALLADLILQNYGWKRLIMEAVHSRQLPLWDPYIFAGHPFLANGQHSALYPLSIVFYVLPLWRAYGVFIWLQLGLAGVWTYLFARTLGVSRLGSLVAGITFQFSGFMVVTVVHPMIVAGGSWLPFLLATVEWVVKQRPFLTQRPASLPWVLLGAVALSCHLLVGHAEITYFVLLVTAGYALWRLSYEWLTAKVIPTRAAGWLALMAVLGLALGALQLVPFYEVAVTSFRAGEAWSSLRQVLGWAYPPRRLIAFAIPNFFGNPAHHGYFDLFQWRPVPATANAYGEPILAHEWGIKNYVEGGAYLGLLPLLLAVLAIISSSPSHPSVGAPAIRRLERLLNWLRHPYVPFFTLLSMFSLGCAFGTPLYALVYVLPFIRQSHSPFRWVYPLSLSVAVLAGFGMDVVRGGRIMAERGEGCQRPALRPRWAFRELVLLKASPSSVTLLAGLAFWGGLVTLAGLLLSRVFFSRIEPLVEAIFWGLARAPDAFPDHRAFYSYECPWIALFALLLTASGVVLRLSRCPIYLLRRPVWPLLALVVLVLDMVSFGLGFNPAVDPALLDYTPPVVEYLRQDTSLWRYATFTPPGTTKTMNANVGMLYRLQTVAGYDSTFSRQYTDYMRLIEEQGELLYSRIASFSQWSSLDSPLMDMLNVKYILTEVEIPNPAKYRLVYQDRTVRVYENLGVLPRAFTLSAVAAVAVQDVAQALRTYDVHHYVVLDADCQPAGLSPQPADPIPQTVTKYTLNEVFVDVSVAEPSWLVLADSHFPGWRAFVRPQAAGEETEQEVPICRTNGNFRGVYLEPGVWTVRFKYSPNSVKLGAFASFLAGMVILFLTGLYLWRFFYREEDEASTVRRVAKNSLAPIVLNLFNRAIEMAFAALMARLLGPVGNGRYATAVNIYLLFDIIANFGLDMYLMREVARDRARAWPLLVNTTVLRLGLVGAVLPVLVGFLSAWQSLGTPLASETVWATVLLYGGLLPGSVAYGLAALFRGYEKHEYPAAIQTVTTVIKVTLGVLALVGGLGIVGLAGASILTNAATLVVLTLLAPRVIWSRTVRTKGPLVWPLQRTMLGECWPLMLSLLLQSLFPSVNLLLLQRLQGDAVVGWYDAARKWVDALNIIPSFFTFAVFPVMARQAAEDRPALQQSYRLSVKLLTLLALPAAVLATLLARTLVGILSGPAFLPHGAIALEWLIWSIVLGWINSLTNYVLIALNRQKVVLWASAARVVYTVATNLLLVRTYSYVASAWIIIGGELLLAALFYADLRRHIGAVRWGKTLGRIALAGLAMGATVWAVAPYSHALALLAGLLVYPLALGFLRVFTPQEQESLAPLLPALLRRLVPQRDTP